MKISVVIPVYNAERSLRSTLDSVLGQTYHDWECICVDDGSVDASGSILDGYAAKDARFRVIHKENGGEGSARNAGMDAATGELIAFLDSDDRMHPEALGLFFKWRKLTGYEMLRYEAHSVSDPAAPFVSFADVPVCEKVDFAHCGESPFVFCALGWATVITRELSRQLRWTGLKQGADMVFVMDCLLRAESTYRTRERLVNYCIDPNSISRRLTVGLLKGTCDYLPVVMAKADELGIDEDMRIAGEAHVRDILLRRMPGSWRLLDDKAERRIVERSFWHTLRMMSARPSFCRGVLRSAVVFAARRENLFFLRMLVAFPYRFARKVIR